MPFPASDREIYRNNPLKDVVCQVRFPPILEILSTEPASFQNLIRRKYPLYTRDTQAVDLPTELAEIMKQIPLQIAAPPVHRFQTPEQDLTISLSGEFIAVNTTSYRQWDQFYAEVETALKAIQEVYAPAFFMRIGLRYVDVIDRGEIGLKDAKWADLLRPSFLNLLGSSELRDEVIGITTQALIRVDEVPGGQAALRHGVLDRGPDKDDAYLIDVDFFTGERRPRDDVSSILFTFHRMAGYLFRWAITDTLRDALGPEPLEPD